MPAVVLILLTDVAAVLGIALSTDLGDRPSPVEWVGAGVLLVAAVTGAGLGRANPTSITLVTAGALLPLLGTAPGARGWLTFAALTVGALIHVALTRPDEERRRGRRLRTHKIEHVDLTSIWLFTAGAILPIHLAASVVLIVRARRYLVARKPPSRWLFSSSAIMLSVLAVHATVRSPGGGVPKALSLALAIGLYFTVQAVLIGAFRGFLTHDWRPQNLVGSRADNILIVNTLMVAAVATVVASAALPALIGVLIVAVCGNRHLATIAALRSDSLHDRKLELLNFEGFRLYAEAALVLDREAGHQTSVLMCDIDHFKTWNDTYGHFAGDEILRAVADVLRAGSREHDLVCRWGGEELILLLPNTAPEDGVALAERLRAKIEALTTTITQCDGGEVHRLGEHGVPPCTISIGVSAAPAHGDSLEQLGTAADTALYAAKHAGRNQVRLAAEPVTIPVQARRAAQPGASRITTT